MTYVDEELDVVAPYIANPIVGSQQTILAPKLFAGRSFSGWSDGVASLSRTFTTTAQPKTFTAVYTNRAPKAVMARGISTSSKRRRSIVLDARSSADPEGEALSYLWSFSDRTRMRGGVVRKSFKRNGRYTVRLNVTDALGAKAEARGRIVVSSSRGVRLSG
jgi:hypothetical protein